MRYQGIREEELKNKVAADWFKAFDTTVVESNIDFALYPKAARRAGERRPLLWAEAKTGNYPTTAMLAQLILTIGKARTFDRILPTPLLGAFGGQKIVFLSYSHIEPIFHLNDFNWKVASSDHTSREFTIVEQHLEVLLDTQGLQVYDFEADAQALRAFIKDSLTRASSDARILIDKNNFYPIYLQWLKEVKPIIDTNWDDLKRHGFLDSDFFLADLFVDDRDTAAIDDDVSIRKNLFVVFSNASYIIAKENLPDSFNKLLDAIIPLRDKKAYQHFWARYKRPPLAEYQEYILDRCDLLVPQDIRERKGAFFTPSQWVALSQQYLADTLGPDWQEEYYVWDCAAGTGNLLAGLTNAPNLYASTLDTADVQVMHERIEKGANLLRGNVFQFDFLNDPFIPQSQGGKLPDDLFEIIQDPEKRKHLLIYINPPYAEASTARTVTGSGSNKPGTSTGSRIWTKYKQPMGAASNELFALFLFRAYREMPGATIANFSTLKVVQAPNFTAFRKGFLAKLEALFLMPAFTFDNVRGKFPIGFFIWNTQVGEPFVQIEADVYDETEAFIGRKRITAHADSTLTLNQWFSKNYTVAQDGNTVGLMSFYPSDFQNQQRFSLLSTPQARYCVKVNRLNLIGTATYFAVRKCILTTWLNNQDQFFQPDDGWGEDREFQSDCLVYMLFHDKNNIRSTEGDNHWIPFTEMEVGASHRFQSHFMADFMAGKLGQQAQGTPRAHLFQGQEAQAAWVPNAPIAFTPAAQAVLDAGRALWRYYHAQPGANANASYYDIREHFQGRNEKGRMNPSSPDATYSALLATLREAMGTLAAQIEPKVYQYGFLKGEPEGL